MTNEIIVDCKYKFQHKEKFNGKPYCTLFNELCHDISVICDANCNVYEDYKQLQRLKQENKCKHLVLNECSKTGENCIGLKQCLLKLEQENEALKMQEEEGLEIIDCYRKENFELKQENDELKQYKGSKQASYEAMQRKVNGVRDVYIENARLKKWNEELKLKNHYLETASGEILAEINTFKIARDEWKQEAQRLRKALADIKEFAEELSNDLSDALDPEETDSEESMDMLYGLDGYIDKILAKIAEVENDG